MSVTSIFEPPGATVDIDQDSLFRGADDKLYISLTHKLKSSLVTLLQREFSLTVTDENELMGTLNSHFGGVKQFRAQSLAGEGDQHRIKIFLPIESQTLCLDAYVNEENLTAYKAYKSSIEYDGKRKNVRSFEKTYTANLVFGKGRSEFSRSCTIVNLKHDLNSLRDKGRIKKAVGIWETTLEIQEAYLKAKTIELNFDRSRFLDDESKIGLNVNEIDLFRNELETLKKKGGCLDLYGIDGGDTEEKIEGELILEAIEGSEAILRLGKDLCREIQAGAVQIPRQGRLVYAPDADMYQVKVQRKAIRRLILGEQNMPQLAEVLFADNDDLQLPPLGETKPLSSKDFLKPKKVNEEQRRAVEMALATPDCFFMQGPPGTGKTTFIVELSYQIAKAGGRVLICSQSNMAVDNALSRLDRSADILAIRLGSEHKVDAIGKPFYGDNAIRRWLAGLSDRAELQKEKLEILSRRSRLFDDHWTDMEEWQSLERDIDKINHDINSAVRSTTAIVDDSRSQLAVLNAELDSLSKLLESVRENGFCSIVKDSPEVLYWSFLDNGELYKAWSQQYIPSAAMVDSPWGSVEKIECYAGRFNSSVFIQQWGDYRKRIETQAQKLVTEYLDQNVIHKEIIHLINGKLAPAVKDARGMLEKIETRIGDFCRKSVIGWCLTGEPIPLYRIENVSATARFANEKINSLLLSIGDVGTEEDGQQKEPSVEAAFGDIFSISSPDSVTANLDSLRREIRQRMAVWDLSKVSIMTTIASIFSKSAAQNVKREEEAESSYKILASHIKRKFNSLFIVKEKKISIKRNINDSRLGKAIIDDINSHYRALESEHSEVMDRFSRVNQQRRDSQRKLDYLEEKIGELYADFLERTLGELIEINLIDRIQRTTSNDFDSTERDLRVLIETTEAAINRDRKYLQGEWLSQVQSQQNEQVRMLEALQDRERLSVNTLSTNIAKATADIIQLEQSLQDSEEDLSDYRLLWEDLRRECGLSDRYPAEDVDLDCLRRDRDDWLRACGGSADLLSIKVRLNRDWNDELYSALEQSTITTALRKAFDNQVNVVGSTCGHAGNYSRFLTRFPQFDCVIIDEISKATAIEILIPALLGKKVIFAGDYMQLPPILGHEESYATAADALGLESGQLKAELERNYFRERYLYFRNNFPDRSIGLTRQYRMHSDIMKSVNQFYVDPLELGEPGQDYLKLHSLTAGNWLTPNNHIVWIDLPYTKAMGFTQLGGSRYNTSEVNIIARLVDDLSVATASHGGASLDVGITSVYGAQTVKLSNRLGNNQYANLNLSISTVDQFQGREKEIMIVSLVMNRDKDNPAARILPSKYLQTPERINVAFSRAQQLLVIVGCSEVYCNMSFPAAKNYGNVMSIAKQTGGYYKVQDIDLV